MYKAIRIILLCLLSVIVLFPLFYAFSTSFFTPQDFTAENAKLLPSSLSLRNYELALSHRYFGRYVLNSFITATLTAFLRAAISAMTAFAFTHLRFKGQKAILTLLLTTLFIPPDAMLYENYVTVARLSLLDSYLGIVLPSLFSASAMLITIGAYLSTDRDIYDAARIDGSRDPRYILSILLPLTAPVTITVFIQAFISSFNSYLWPLLITTRPKMRTVQVGIMMLGFAEEGEYGAQSASIILITLPFLLLLAAGRKAIEKALQGGISS
ncbi:MAG: carbohydrate ABC transporter permease [Spirochaetes bacterium]|uniref:sn-glycerol-3-phosphate transport system permease protein UgpE n=1 Tax=Candidatus Ornithospirochaeta stercoripullorum TaxID=2840899 RepID=A0A9D9H612_9SPIO|nr:carbohydrate ABC transporter permease [Candidatus Ornithospirochaeta stercoripullorum]